MATVVALSAAGCGGGGTAPPRTVTIASGQIPRSAVLVGGAGAAGLAGSTGTTVPLAKQNPTTAFFTAIGVFQSCLSNLGVTFVGAPDPSDPNSPANNPSYLKSLGTCAARSDIVQALNAEKTAQDDLTPKQVAQENRSYLKWRTCMIGRGWQIPQPTPDAKGALFSFGGSGGSGPQMTPPPGQSLLSSPDMQACMAQVQRGSS